MRQVLRERWHEHPSTTAWRLLGLGVSTPACHSSGGGDVVASDAGPTSPEAPPQAAAATSRPAPSAPLPPSPPAPPAGSGATDAVVGITVLAEGRGPAAQDGDRVKVHYTASLADGTQFASSREKNQPLEFTIGERSITRGMSQGVTGMKVGEKRRLVVPPALAYGERSNAKIPPNSTLVYEVELLAIKPK